MKKVICTLFLLVLCACLCACSMIEVSYFTEEIPTGSPQPEEAVLLRQVLEARIQVEILSGEELPLEIQYMNALLSSISFEVLSVDEEQKIVHIASRFVDVMAMTENIFGDDEITVEEYYKVCIQMIQENQAPVLEMNLSIPYEEEVIGGQVVYTIVNSEALAELLSCGVYSVAETYLSDLLSYIEKEYPPEYIIEEVISYLQETYWKEQDASASTPATDAPQIAPTPTEKTTSAPTPTPTPHSENSSGPQVGDVMTVGYYEQDNDWSDGAESIEWIVLDRVGNEAMLISRYALDCGIYNQMDTNVQWRNSGLQDWLNNTFLYNAFSVQEQGRLVAKTAKADKNPDYDTNPGTDSRDRVTLLSVSEAQKYFSGNDARTCKATMYAVAQGVQINGEGNCWWWLRTPGQFAGYAAGIFRNGEIDTVGDVFYHEGDAIRPVIWITLEESADEEAGVNVLSSEERAWFESNFPYEDSGFISVSGDEFIFPYGDFRGYIFPETAQFYSDTQGIVLARVMEEVEIFESQYASSYVKGLKVGDTIQLDEFDPIEIQSIEWQNGNCVLNDFYVLLAKSEDTFVYRMSRMRLCEYEGRGILTWIAIGNDTHFAAGEGSNFDAKNDSFKRYIETYDGREVTFSIWDDRCTWMYESGLT